MSFVILIIGITVYQEQKTERALEALRNLSSPRALVIRDGEQKRIPGREVVCGDMLILAEGDRVPADGVLLFSNNVQVDESLLTGESVPVRKIPWSRGMRTDRPGGDDQPTVFSGTLVVQGQGLAEVRATGPRTEMGKIGAVLQTVERGDTRLKTEIARIVRTIAIVGLFLCVTIVVVYGLTRGNWLEGFLAGITLAMAILPEEFPVVLTVFLALGAWRISRKNVLTRQVSAIETLGSATVLCVDKTGTLTENRMAVQKYFAGGQMCTHGHQDLIPCRRSAMNWLNIPFSPAKKTPSTRWNGHFTGSRTGISGRPNISTGTGNWSRNTRWHRISSRCPMSGGHRTGTTTSSRQKGHRKPLPISAITIRTDAGT